MKKSIIINISTILSVSFANIASSNPLPIQTDGSTNTQITQTQNGIDQINTATATKSGVSHNKFTNYNVNTSGQIINNFHSDNPLATTTTTLGGEIFANQNLSSSKSAKLIINEVTSTNNSQLLGQIEIAGTQADLIIANPNGITCNGCGFINTSRISLIAGNIIKKGNKIESKLTNYNSQLPQLITISGLGLNANNTNLIDIIASKIKINSSINAHNNSNIKIIGGEGRYNYNKNSLSINNSPNNSNQEQFAIDASELSQINAGNIYIIGTQKGFGINLQGNINSAKSLTLSSNGNLSYKNINSQESFNASGNNIKQTGEAIIEKDINIKAINFENENNLTSINGNTFILANIFSNSGEINANNINIKKNRKNSSSTIDIFNNGIIFAKNNLTIESKLLINNGALNAKNTNKITTNELNNNSLAEITGDQNINLHTKYLTENKGEIRSDGNIRISSTNSSLENSGLIVSPEVKIFSEGLNNSGNISGGNLILISRFKKAKDKLSVTNDGTLFSFADINIFAKNFTNNDDIRTKNLNITAKNVTNNKTMRASNNISIDGNNLINNDFILAESGIANIKSIISVENNKNITAGNNIVIRTNHLKNNPNANISSGQTLKIAGYKKPNSQTTNEGLLYSHNDNIELTSKNLTNQGEVRSRTNNITINAPDFYNQGTINAANKLEITSTRLAIEDSSIITANQVVINQ